MQKSMEQNYQLELKHLASRVPGGVLCIAGLKSAGDVLFMDFTVLTTRERMDGKGGKLVSPSGSSGGGAEGQQ